MHAAYEKAMFSNGVSAVKLSLSNTKRIHNPENTVGIAMMTFMGYCLKTFNLLTKGKFTLE